MTAHPVTHLARGSQGWEIRREVAPIRGDIVINKTHSDAFYQTDFTPQLETRGATHLIVTGYMSQYCVDITVRRAVELGYVVTLVADGYGICDDGALRHDQITAHHNILLGKIYDPRDAVDGKNHQGNFVLLTGVSNHKTMVLGPTVLR